MIRFEEVPALLGGLLSGTVPRDWPEGEVAAVSQDSRRLRPAGLYVAIRGTTADGREFIPEAVSRGAVGIVGEPPALGPLPYLAVRDPRRAVALLAARHAGEPSQRLDLVGITGTNGKTTTSWLLQSIWDGCGVPGAVLGTLGSGSPGALRATSHTTPDAPRFQSILRDLLEEGYQAVAAEVSSHALDQERTYATRFRSVVFTNLSRDHLDYHVTFDAYLAAKRKLFHPEGRGDTARTVAVVNLDDPALPDLVRGSPDPVFGYGTSPDAAVRLEGMAAGPDGLDLRVQTPGGRRRIRTPLIGVYNGWNLLAAYAAALSLDLPIDAVEETLARGVRVPGRMERIDKGQGFLVLVDYAHTPDALDRVLAALRPLTRGRLVVVFGCGGDRDPGKRPEMGAIAARRADLVILTSDNPRSEEPQAILRAIEEGVRGEGREADSIEADREAAIREALRIAAEGDTVLIAGKGHESYQETASGRRPFDDREVAEQGLIMLGWNR